MEVAPQKRNIIIWIKSSQKETFSTHYHKGISYLQLANQLSNVSSLFFAYNANSYSGDDVFYPAYEYKDGELSKKAIRMKANIIYNLGNIPDENFHLANAVISNTPEFKKFFASKFNAYNLLKSYFPKTIFINTEKDFFEQINNIAAEKIVFKPDTGTNGRGVMVFDKATPLITEEMKTIIKEGALLQEFIDTNNGVPELCNSYHDLRLAIVNNTIALAHMRIPKEGSLIANYHQGASIQEIDRKKLPPAVIELYENVHDIITQRFPSPMYTMDMGVNTQGDPLLFEINSTTAFPWPEFQSKDFFIEQLVLHLNNLR